MSALPKNHIIKIKCPRCNSFHIKIIPADLVLDPMCGSGTTCVAAKMLNRRFIGIDISPEYCEIARKRLEQLQNQSDNQTSNSG